jgi:hypothetical protein
MIRSERGCVCPAAALNVFVRAISFPVASFPAFGRMSPLCVALDDEKSLARKWRS